VTIDVASGQNIAWMRKLHCRTFKSTRKLTLKVQQ